MANRKPLVLIGGRTAELPAGDTLSVTSGSFLSTFADASSGGSDGNVQTQLVGAAFTQINLPTENSDAGGSYNPTTSLYTASANGLYLIVAKVRIKDSEAAGRAVGVGVHTSAADGPWFVWSETTGTSGGRKVIDYQRIMFLTAGQTVQLYAYCSTSTWLASASLNIVRLQ